MATLARNYSENPTPSAAASLEAQFMDYIYFSQQVQHTNNPSGGYATGGLGEPKFNVDGTPFTGPWGRPQRDGPALRALTLIKFLKAYNSSHPTFWTGQPASPLLSLLYDSKLPTNSIIKADLEYVAHNWQETGFDLWEEVNGSHFFTSMAQMASMKEGRDLAYAFGDPGAGDFYDLQYKALGQFMGSFWDAGKNHLIETLGTSRSGLDCALPLGAIHGEVDDPGALYQSWTDEVLVSTLDLIQDAKTRFPINSAAASSGDPLAGVGVGRYPEDVYDGDGTTGGNPWFLCTTSISEVVYRAVSHFSQQGWLSVSELGEQFYGYIYPGLGTGNYTATSGPEFNQTLQKLMTFGDNFLSVVQTHAASTGSLSEEFDHNTGFERGARDLTWSYGSFLEAAAWRTKAQASLGK
jgi:glucoamylase